MIKVMIIDGHEAVLDAFSNVIDRQDDMECIAGSANSHHIEELCEKLMPDILLTAVYVEQKDSGIKLTQKIKQSCPQIKIVTMSSFNDIAHIPEAKNAGADAFVSKSRPLSELLSTIRTVMSGEKVFPSAVEVNTSNGTVNFSGRELEVLRLLCKSYKKKEISEQLNISQGTVKRHVENMLSKAGCKSSIELVVQVMEKGLVCA